MDNSKIYIRELQDFIWNHTWQIVSGSNEIEIETKAVTGVIKITKQYLFNRDDSQDAKVSGYRPFPSNPKVFLWRNLQERVFIDID